MFQAQVSGRGQIQYVANPGQAERWVDEWVEGQLVIYNLCLAIS
jgi:CRISPR-associated protein Cmr6